jgi:hypothetical protein
VTNLYAAAMLFIGEAAGDDALFESYLALADGGEEFLKTADASVGSIGGEDWTSAAVLSDGEGFGVGKKPRWRSTKSPTRIRRISTCWTSVMGRLCCSTQKRL